MNQRHAFSLMQPAGAEAEYRKLPDNVMHDLGLLLNETYSTTSFEEGYYIARDSIKALLNKGVRTIYNTHMHKLGEDVEELTEESAGTGAASLIMKTEEGKRSFRVALAKPEGSSYARDIAEKYGVTYDMLVGGSI